MGYEVLALKYRPQAFEDCVGQEEVAKTLKNAIIQNRIGHAYLFTGPRGVGKTSLARIFAKVINCPNVKDAIPCNSCSNCTAISKCISMDVIEFDGASNNKVEDIRDLISNVDYQPVNSKYKVYIIDEVHMVTNQGFNALLKTLEEPPEHVKFIFATTELQKLPETILSRCQILNFRQIQQADIVKRLKFICDKEKIKYQDEALNMIATKARGAHRDSQSILDQAIAYSNSNLTAQAVREVTGAIPDDDILNLLEKIFQNKESEIFIDVRNFIAKGFDLSEVCERMMEILRDIIVIQVCPTQSTTLVSNTFYIEKLNNLSQLVRRDGIQYMIQMLSETKIKIRNSNQPYVLLEMTILKMCHSTDLLALAEIAKEIRTQKLTQPINNNAKPSELQPTNPKTTDAPKEENPLFRKRQSENNETVATPKANFSENDLKQNWPAMIANIAKTDATFASILTTNKAVIKEVVDKTVFIEVSGSNPRVLSTLDTDNRKQIISNLIHQTYQIPFKVSFVVADSNISKKKVEISVTPNSTNQLKGDQPNLNNPAKDVKKVSEQEIITDPDMQKIIREMNCQVIDIIKKDN